MRGKYSPTVSTAYRKNQDWWDNYSRGSDGSWNQYDPDGYDSYGYNSEDIDRAGNYENDYYADDCGDENWKYNQAYDTWGFDGVKPVEVKV